MKKKRCKTAMRRNIIIGIFISISLILCIFFGHFYIRFAQGYSTFNVPDHETSIIKGKPSKKNVKNYEELPVKEGYTVGIDTTPVFRDGKLYLNVANLKDNTVWFMVRIYLNEEKIGESGIFYQDEFVETIDCDRKLLAGDKILIKIMAYEPDTYHSEGVAQISTVIAK